MFVPLAKINEFMANDVYTPSLAKHINDILVRQNEELLSKIVKMALGKETFDLHEVKRFSFIRFEHLSKREFIGLDDEVIGEMAMFQKEENRQWKMGFEFIPGKMEMQNGALQFVPNPQLN